MRRVSAPSARVPLVRGRRTDGPNAVVRVVGRGTQSEDVSHAVLHRERPGGFALLFPAPTHGDLRGDGPPAPLADLFDGEQGSARRPQLHDIIVVVVVVHRRRVAPVAFPLLGPPLHHLAHRVEDRLPGRGRRRPARLTRPHRLRVLLLVREHVPGRRRRGGSRSRRRRRPPALVARAPSSSRSPRRACERERDPPGRRVPARPSRGSPRAGRRSRRGCAARDRRASPPARSPPSSRDLVRVPRRSPWVGSQNTPQHPRRDWCNLQNSRERMSASMGPGEPTIASVPSAISDATRMPRGFTTRQLDRKAKSRARS